jgi:hypothetical protein
MKRKTEAVCIVLMLGLSLMSTYGFAEEPGSGRTEAELKPQTREALAAAIQRRERELELRAREDVFSEVEKRMVEMGVDASAAELTDLLMDREQLNLAFDKCRLEGTVGTAGCRALKADLARVETRFRKATGLSSSEFRSGRRETPRRRPRADRSRRPRARPALAASRSLAPTGS